MGSQLSCTCEALCRATMHAIECSSGCHWHGPYPYGRAGTCASACAATAWIADGLLPGGRNGALPMRSRQCHNLSAVTHMTVHEVLGNKLSPGVNAYSFEAEG